MNNTFPGRMRHSFPALWRKERDEAEASQKSLGGIAVRRSTGLPLQFFAMG